MTFVPDQIAPELVRGLRAVEELLAASKAYVKELEDTIASTWTYDEKHAIESDALAAFHPGDLKDERLKDHPITIDLQTGNPPEYFHVGVREARVLAARLLRAADAAETAGARGT